jgi:hypothetical protein
VDDHFRELEQQGKRVEWHPEGYIVRDYEGDWAWGYYRHRWGGSRTGVGRAEGNPFFWCESSVPTREDRWPKPIYWWNKPWWRRLLGI